MPREYVVRGWPSARTPQATSSKSEAAVRSLSLDPISPSAARPDRPMTDVSAPVAAATPAVPCQATSRAVPVVDVVVSCIVVYEFAIAQPLLDLLGRNAEFFVARRSPPSDVITTALIVAVLIPAVLGLIVGGVGRLHAPTGAGAPLDRAGRARRRARRADLRSHAAWPISTGWIQVVLALALGALLTFAYYRLSALRYVTSASARSRRCCSSPCSCSPARCRSWCSGHRPRRSARSRSGSRPRS